MPYEIGRLAQDLAGGLMVTLPSQQDFAHPEIGKLLEKYLKGREDIPTENRVRILRLIENMTLGRNAVVSTLVKRTNWSTTSANIYPGFFPCRMMRSKANDTWHFCGSTDSNCLPHFTRRYRQR
jgi:hypothetical protein